VALIETKSAGFLKNLLALRKSLIFGIENYSKFMYSRF